MSEELKPCEIPCPKCGSSDVMRRFWCKNETCRESKKYDESSIWKYSRVSGWTHYATRDHITHHCRCCQYNWETLPMSKKTCVTKQAIEAVTN